MEISQGDKPENETQNENDSKPAVGPDGLTAAEREAQSEAAAQKQVDAMSIFPKPYRGALPVFTLAWVKYIVAKLPTGSPPWLVMKVNGIIVTVCTYITLVNFYVYFLLAMYAWTDFYGFVTVTFQIILASSLAILSLMRFYDEPWQDMRPGGGMVQPMSWGNARRWATVFYNDAITCYGVHMVYQSATTNFPWFLVYLVSMFTLSWAFQTALTWWFMRYHKPDPNAKPLFPGTKVKVKSSMDTIHFPYTPWGGREGVVKGLTFDQASKRMLYSVQLEPENPCGTLLQNVVSGDVECLEQNPQPKMPEPEKDDERVKVRAMIQFCGG